LDIEKHSKFGIKHKLDGNTVIGMKNFFKIIDGCISAVDKLSCSRVEFSFKYRLNSRNHENETISV
jgi:hypothetical protein